MTTLVEEGDLTFEFPAECKVSKYDEWTFYRKRFNSVAGGSKAVDFLCMDGSHTWLIEVKDYSQHQRKKTSELHEEVAAKVRDTLAGIAAAQVNADDVAEREAAQDALGKSWRVVLHLELPSATSRLRRSGAGSLMTKLRRAIKAIDPHAQVVGGAASTTVPWRAYRKGAATRR